MAIINVLRKTVDGAKTVFLRDVDRDTFPWTYPVVREKPARGHVADHEHNCDFESEAESYFETLSA